MEIGKRVLVLGCPGSGKSSFSRRLRAMTGLPLIHLDNIWWRPDRTHISREEFDRRLVELLQGEAWILDGDYSRTYEPRIRACDTVFFLDFDEEVCLAGTRERLGSFRPDMPWTEREPDPALEAMVRSYRRENRPRLLALLARYQDKRTLIFQSRREADAWLAARSGPGST